MFELQHLTPQERIEYFEQRLRDALSPPKTLQSLADQQTAKLEKLLQILRQTWSAHRASCWKLHAKQPAAFHNRSHATFEREEMTVDAATQRLIELASAHAGILWVEPSATRKARRALGRVPWPNDGITPAVIEIEYESSSGSDLPVARDAILHGLEHCLQMIARYGSSLFLESSTASQRCSAVDQMAIDVLHQRRRLCQELTEKLGSFSGQALATLEDKQAFVRAIHTLLDDNGLRLECPTCGEPAILRCMKTGNSLQGCFLFDHRVGGKRTMHGGRNEIPSLVVTDKPVRAKRKLIVAKVQKS